MGSKRKILHIVEAMGGGVFTYIVDLANELAKNYVLFRSKNYFDARIQLIEVINFNRSINVAKDVAVFFEITRIAKEVKPDVIHLHSSKAGAIGRFAFSGRKVPLFYTPHGYSFLMQNTGFVKRKIYKLIERICGRKQSRKDNLVHILPIEAMI